MRDTVHPAWNCKDPMSKATHKARTYRSLPCDGSTHQTWNVRVTNTLYCSHLDSRGRVSGVSPSHKTPDESTSSSSLESTMVFEARAVWTSSRTLAQSALPRQTPHQLSEPSAARTLSMWSAALTNSGTGAPASSKYDEIRDGGPTKQMRPPSPKSTTLSKRQTRAQEGEWIVARTVRCSDSETSTSSCPNCFAAVESNPEVGSSINKAGRSDMNSMAAETRLRWPPETPGLITSPTRLSLTSSNFSFNKMASALARRAPRSSSGEQRSMAV
mmetsp:Transcript_66/g.278  ORF Transcript_66/g.278 Transcript_66/m.278 type:complete len:272 (+) Transcript_66:2850-3665(+)